MLKSNENDLVVLVDTFDRPVGSMDKMEAHVSGALHRAFSIFVINNDGELLLQRRAFDKYHSGGLWSNTCCSHPRPDESVVDAAHRRLNEEMGLSCKMEPAFTFVYKAELEGGLVEHEFDHVFIGYDNEAPSVNQAEVAEWRYTAVDEIGAELERCPDDFSIWFRLSFERVVNAMERQENELRTAA